MTAIAPISLVSSSDALFRYPIPAFERLETHSWFPFHFDRFDRSEFRIQADLEVQAIYLRLLCAAMREGPVGTLPTNEVFLADAARIPLDQWRRLAARDISPLYGWKPCLCDNNAVRLYHPVVLENVTEALKGRSRWLEGAESERERKRLGVLPERIVRAGGSTRQSEDKAFVLALDQFLLDHLPAGKSRTPKVVRRAMEMMETGEVGPI